MTPTTQQISDTAKKLLEFLQKTGGAWKGNCMDYVFSKPRYESIPNAQRAYWQWETNAYGGNQIMPVGDESVTFTQSIEKTYSSQISDAYQELKKAGLADETNNGYNEYFIFPLIKSNIIQL